MTGVIELRGLADFAADGTASRLIQRQGTVVVRDETRRVDADSRDDALSIARVLSDEGFTVWVWAVDGGASEAWDLVERIGSAVVEGAGSIGASRRPATR